MGATWSPFSRVSEGRPRVTNSLCRCCSSDGGCCPSFRAWGSRRPVPVFDYDDEGDEMDEENDMAFESLLLAGSQRYSQDQRNDIHTRTSGGPSNRRHDAAFWESVAGLFARLRRGRHSHPHSQHHDHIHHQQHTGRPRGYDAIPPPTVHASPDRYGISEEDDALLLADQEDAVQELTEAQIQEIVEKAAAQQAPL